MKINLGCGSTDYRNDRTWINIDKSEAVDCDLHLDVTQGLPFEEDSTEEVHSGCMLEQLDPKEFLFVVNECYRVLQKGGRLHGYVPSTDPRVLHLDPMDRMFFQPDSFRYLVAGDVHYERFGRNYGFKAWTSYSAQLNENGIIYFELVK